MSTCTFYKTVEPNFVTHSAKLSCNYNIHHVYSNLKCIQLPTLTLITDISDHVTDLKRTVMTEFYVSLTVHLGIILVNNQLDALFSMYLLFHLSTCFGHSVLIRRAKLY